MSGNPRIGFPFSPHQTISFLTSGPWPTILVLAGYRLVVPRPCAYFTSFVCWKLVYCSCVCHGLKAHLCILPLILDLLWRELFFDLSFFIGLLLSRAEPCLIVGFSPFSPFFALSIVLFSFLPYHSIIPVIVLFDSCLLGLLGLLPILLSMTQYGHWIYTHATLGFLNSLHCSWAPLSHFFLLKHPWPICFPWPSLALFLTLHSHGLLLTLLGFPGLITLFFILGAYRLSTNPLLFGFITLDLLWPILTFLHLIMPMGLQLLSLGSFKPICFPQGPFIYFMGL